MAATTRSRALAKAPRRPQALAQATAAQKSARIAKKQAQTTKDTDVQIVDAPPARNTRTRAASLRQKNSTPTQQQDDQSRPTRKRSRSIEDLEVEENRRVKVARSLEPAVPIRPIKEPKPVVVKKAKKPVSTSIPAKKTRELGRNGARVDNSDKYARPITQNITINIPEPDKPSATDLIQTPKRQPLKEVDVNVKTPVVTKKLNTKQAPPKGAENLVQDRREQKIQVNTPEKLQEKPRKRPQMKSQEKAQERPKERPQKKTLEKAPEKPQEVPFASLERIEDVFVNIDNSILPIRSPLKVSKTPVRRHSVTFAEPQVFVYDHYEESNTPESTPPHFCNVPTVAPAMLQVVSAPLQITPVKEQTEITDRRVSTTPQYTPPSLVLQSNTPEEKTRRLSTTPQYTPPSLAPQPSTPEERTEDVLNLFIDSRAMLEPFVVQEVSTPSVNKAIHENVELCSVHPESDINDEEHFQEEAQAEAYEAQCGEAGVSQSEIIDRPQRELPLKDCMAYLDIRTNDNIDSSAIYSSILTRLGAKIVPHFNPYNAAITHIIFKNGAADTLHNLRTANAHRAKFTNINNWDAEQAPAIKCMQVQWVLDCEAATAYVPEEEYIHTNITGLDFLLNTAPRSASRRRSTMLPSKLKITNGEVKRDRRKTLSHLTPAANTTLKQTDYGQYRSIFTYMDSTPCTPAIVRKARTAAKDCAEAARRRLTKKEKETQEPGAMTVKWKKAGASKNLGNDTPARRTLDLLARVDALPGIEDESSLKLDFDLEMEETFV